MKKNALILGLLINIYAMANAQKADGTIVFNNDSIAHVAFELDAMESMQFVIKYYDAAGNKIKLSPDSAKEVRFKAKYDNVRMISCFDNLKLTRKNFFWSQKKIFLTLKADGKLRLYTFYFTQSTPAMSNGVGGTYQYAYGAERSILQKGNGDLYEPRRLHFKKDMKEYLSDCPSLSGKIGDIMYERDNMDYIVREYNLCDRKKNK